jgi:hypothetical protein
MEQNIMKNFTGERLGGAGWEYAIPVTLSYESYYTKETFEIDPLEDFSDIMLPC